MKIIKGNFEPKEQKEQTEAHTNCIKFLEDTLKRAKEEKAVFALIILKLPDDAILDGWSKSYNIRPYTILGALTELSIRFCRKTIEER